MVAIPVTCPRCPAKWYGLKFEHCATCHQTFSSTRTGDKHLVRMNPKTGRSHHLTVEEMRALTHKDGSPWYVERTNPFGTVIWSKADNRPRTYPPVHRTAELAEVIAGDA